MIDLCDRLFLRLRSLPFFLRLTLFTRLLLAAGFIPTGLVKLLGRRFTTIAGGSPIGDFFEAMYQTGLYWNFLGASQMIAGLLLLAPRFAHLGALLFLPIMANIFVITASLGFRGTPIVTGLMLLAVIYLCAWDFHRVPGVLVDPSRGAGPLPPLMKLDRLERVGFVVFGLSLLVFFSLTRGIASGGFGLPTMLVGSAAGLFTLGRFLTTGRRLRPQAPLAGSA